MLAGLPFVASNVGGIMDICNEEQKRFIVHSTDVNDYASKVRELLNNKSVRDELIAAGLAQVKKFSIENSKDIFINLFYHYE
jgi:glycosyltransferase involved in cell wall biosynthesis